MNDNVIAFRSGKPLVETVATEQKTADEMKKLLVDAQLDILDKVRGQIASGNLEGLIIVSRNPETRLFMQEMIFPPNFHLTGDAFAYAGLLEAIKLEMTDISQMAPIIACTGEVINPHIEDEEDE